MQLEGEIFVAILSLLGTALGAGASVLINNKLVCYRIQQLEQKVHAHNNLVERMYKLEQRAEILDVRLKNVEEEKDD